MNVFAERILVANTSAGILSCINCHDQHTFVCTYPDCDFAGEPRCLECGNAAHKKMNHKFDVGLDHIKQTNAADFKENIHVKLYIIFQIRYTNINCTHKTHYQEGLPTAKDTMNAVAYENALEKVQSQNSIVIGASTGLIWVADAVNVGVGEALGDAAFQAGCGTR